RASARIVAQRLKLAAEMMRTDAGLHADQAGWDIGKPCFHLAARPLLTQHNCAAIIEADDVERVLANIDADYRNRSPCCRRHGVLLVSGAPGQLIAGGAGARPDHSISGLHLRSNQSWERDSRAQPTVERC